MTDLTLISRRRLLASGLTSTGGFFVATAFPRMALAKTIAGHGASTAQPAFKPSAYVEIAADGQVTFVIGKSEMGQGTLTGIAQLIADELACDWDSLRIVQADADKAFGFPHNGFMATGGSTGLRSEWMRMRTVGAAARTMLQQAAAKKWSVDIAQATVGRGIIQGPDGRSAAFGELSPLAAQLRVPLKPALKTEQQRTFIGRTVKRLDTVLKTTGQAEYGIDVDVEGMLTAVIIQPPTLMAPVKSFNASKALARPGVSAVLKTSTGVAIVGEHYWAVHSARDDVEVRWDTGPFDTLGTQAIADSYRTSLGQKGQTAEKKGNTSLASTGRTVTREVVQPLLAHACMEPMNFTVSIGPDGAEAWGPTQAQSKVQLVIAKVAGIKPSRVKVHTTFLGGGFGRRSAIDFVQAAAEISKAVGRPVKLVYSREDDMRAGRYRPFTVARASGTLDTNGDLVALSVKVAAPSVSRRSGFPFLIRKDGLDPHAVTGFTGLAPHTIPSCSRRWSMSWQKKQTRIPWCFAGDCCAIVHAICSYWTSWQNWQDGRSVRRPISDAASQLLSRSKASSLNLLSCA